MKRWKSLTAALCAAVLLCGFSTTAYAGGGEYEDYGDPTMETLAPEPEPTLSESCVCGKEHLYYLFTIENVVNGNTLFPIGSSCIKKFGREDLDDEVAVREKMFKLYHAVENNQFISLSPEFFSRKILKKLYEDGAFDCEYNGYDGYDDYEFILKMFNKRDKFSITINQEKKIRAIIVASIRPYLHDQLAGKIKY